VVLAKKMRVADIERAKYSGGTDGARQLGSADRLPFARAGNDALRLAGNHRL